MSEKTFGIDATFPCMNDSELHPILLDMINAMKEARKIGESLTDNTEIGEKLFERTEFLLRRLWQYSMIENKACIIVTNYTTNLLLFTLHKVNDEFMINNITLPVEMVDMVVDTLLQGQGKDYVICEEYLDTWARKDQLLLAMTKNMPSQ